MSVFVTLINAGFSIIYERITSVENLKMNYKSYNYVHYKRMQLFFPSSFRKYYKMITIIWNLKKISLYPLPMEKKTFFLLFPSPSPLGTYYTTWLLHIIWIFSCHSHIFFFLIIIYHVIITILYFFHFILNLKF